jgi:ubiquitin-like modifier-activating enzyme 5
LVACSICAEESRAKFKDTLQSGSIDRKEAVSMIVGCVDNMEARQLMEQMSEELQVPFMDAVVSDDAMGGSVQLIIPGRTGGLEAAPIKSHMEKRPGTCPASLPTTDSIIAGITGQNILKYLLGFGEVAFLLQYNAVTNEFQSRMTYPDPRKAGGVPPA